MVKTITKITDDIIEVVQSITRTEAKQYNKNALIFEKNNLLNKVKEIDEYLAEFNKA